VEQGLDAANLLPLPQVGALSEGRAIVLAWGFDPVHIRSTASGHCSTLRASFGEREGVQT
jgi:hypothetical protein